MTLLIQGCVAEWSKAPDSSIQYLACFKLIGFSGLQWRRGFESHRSHVFFLF